MTRFDEGKLAALARRLEAQGRALEAEAVREIQVGYSAFGFADLIALLGSIDDPNVARRVQRVESLMFAFKRAQRRLETPPDKLRDLLLTAVRQGITTANDMMKTQVAVPELFDAFRIRPAIEIEYLNHAADRLTTYWGIEQQRFANEVQSELVDALERGQGRQQVTARLRERLGVSRSRASLIARNELGNAAGHAMSETQQAAGCTEYIWSSAHDKRVRPLHRARDGKKFEWKHPPSDGHPGQPIQCRCAALALLPEGWEVEHLKTDPPVILPPVVPPAVKPRKPRAPKPAPVPPVPTAPRAQRTTDELRAEARAVRAKLAKNPQPDPVKLRAALQARVDALAEVDRLRDLYYNGKATEKEWKRVRDAASKARDVLEAVQAGAARDLVTVTNTRAKFTGRTTKKYKVGFDPVADCERVMEYVDIPLTESFPVYLDTKRAYHLNGEIHLSRTQSITTAIHEMGHLIELRSPAAFESAKAFFRYRTTGKPLRKLKNKYPGYGFRDDEVFYDGAFDFSKWPGGKVQANYADYCAKSYERNGQIRASELLSMGLQFMHADPIGFAATDPEFFDYIYLVARGGTWTQP